MKTTTKLRLLGGAVLLFNLWLIGRYNLEGIPVLLMTIGFAIGYEYLVVRPSKGSRDPGEPFSQPSAARHPASGATSTATSTATDRPSLDANAHESPIETQDEQLWAAALLEFEGPDRRPGLWSKLFSQAGGNEAAAKAAYISARFSELQEKQNQELQRRQRAAQALADAEKEAKALEEQKRYDALPKGLCPNCQTVLLLTTTKCPKCDAVFGADSAWKILPRGEA